HLGADPKARRLRRDEAETQGLRNDAERLARDGEGGGDESADGQRRHPRLGLPRSLVEDEQGLARGGAVGECEVLLIDVVLAQGNREQHAEQSGWGEPGENLRTG